MEIDVEKAEWFARIKHDGQFRATGDPYIVHPIRVAKILESIKPDSQKLKTLTAAAYLHDTIEDTDTSFKELERHFGREVASIVLELSSAPFASDYSGKEKYLAAKMLIMTPYALTVKLADRLDNICDMETFSEEKKLSKFNETLEIIKVLKESSNITQTQAKLIDQIERAIGC